MSKAVCILLLGLSMSASGYKISLTCVDLCKADSTIKCSGPCDLNTATLESLSLTYGRDVVDACVNPCQCGEQEHVYAGDKVCEIIQSFVLANAGKDCKCRSDVWAKNLSKWNIQKPAEYARSEVIDYLLKHESVVEAINRLRPRASVTVDQWDDWCKHHCTTGMGGSVCYCDIVP
ncbi:hypothetical protein TSAR_008105 [Trichomalopsis sarcophagae]|uniref:Uncharacterized protein n=1 Tax=Trichomalopsis sarcophagae TaxID=543379 RepID=A0A232ERC6_9HYME|nr:hypothetical protein TSAR_008105 [Trichomalopsis sarcophagae]